MTADLLEVMASRWIHEGLNNYLQVDGLRPGSGNYRDVPQRLQRLYDAAFENVYRAHAFRNQTVCFEELVTQPTFIAA